MTAPVKVPGQYGRSDIGAAEDRFVPGGSNEIVQSKDSGEQLTLALEPSEVRAIFGISDPGLAARLLRYDHPFSHSPGSASPAFR